MKSSTNLGSTLLIFLILLTKSPLNSSKKSDVHPTVTAAVIVRICAQVEDRGLCFRTLNPLIGQPYLIKALLPPVKHDAEATAEEARAEFMALQRRRQPGELVPRVVILEFSQAEIKVRQQLGEAINVMNADRKTIIKEHTKVAIQQHVRAARDNLEIWRRASAELDNQIIANLMTEIRGLCNIMLAICNEIAG